MAFFSDLRFLLPPLTNLLLLILKPEGLFPLDLTGALSWTFQNHPIFIATFSFLSISITLFFFLCTSVELQLTPLSLLFQFGYFSWPLTIAMITAVVLSPEPFWMLFLLLILFRLWRGTFLYAFNAFVRQLQTFPVLIVTFIAHHQNHPQPPLLQPSLPGIPSSAMQDQPSLGQELEIVIGT